jgi:hypothetical protein
VVKQGSTVKNMLLQSPDEARPIAHLLLDCPACGQSVHVVADLDAQRSRWCCLACGTVGIAPFAFGDSERERATVPPSEA